MDIQKLISGIENCACGRSHCCPVDHIAIGSGALEQLPAFCEKYEHILLVSDVNTRKACGDTVEKLLGNKVEKHLCMAGGSDVVIPNEKKIEELTAAVTEKTDLILGIGSGVINDLCKYVSFKKDLPYYIVATAPSMDGYVSVGAALILGGMKVTLNARPPKAVVADTKVLKDAPMEMLQAGYGDIIGKFSCLNDWKLSRVINGEYFCQEVYDLTMECAKNVSTMAQGVVDRDEETVGALMEALVAVGVAMSYVDCSRPASGSEHHLSHYFEITGILEDKPYFAHGIDVAYSAIVTAGLREEILNSLPKARDHVRDNWVKNIRRVYGTSADGVIALQDKLGWYEREESIDWPAVRQVLEEAPSKAEFQALVEAVGLKYEEFENMYGIRKIRDAVLYAKDLKDRYTVLWLYYNWFRPEVKLVAFDLDGTLTQHKSKLSPEHREILNKLGEKYKLLMVGAGTCIRIFNQMEQYPIDIIGNYGMQYGKYNAATGELDIIRDDHAPVDKESVDARVTRFRQKYGYTEFTGENTEFHLSGCVTLPVLGTKAKIEDKLAFDPDRKKRRAIYAEVKELFSDYTVFVGGSSSYDMAPRPYDKDYALDLYCKENGLSHEQVVYVGDDYGPGGNDESVYVSDFGYITIDDYTTLAQRIDHLL